MKIYTIIFLLVTVVHAQQRVIINPTNELTPITQGERAIGTIHGASNPGGMVLHSACPYDSYIELEYNSNFGASSGDVLAMWFVAPIDGSVDTLFWYMPHSIADSTVAYLRIFKSNINTTQGPGFPPHRAPCTPWGYYQTGGPFRNDTSDLWISTISGIAPSFEPFDTLLWGEPAYPVVLKSSSINSVSLDELGYKPYLKKGDVFFVTFEIGEGVERVEWAVSWFDSRRPEYQSYYPSRLWKYYAGDHRPSSCNGDTSGGGPDGWYARGGFENDSSYVALYLWWFAMTGDYDPPPTLLRATHLQSTLSTADRSITAELADCDTATGNFSAIKNAYIEYSLNNVFAGTIPLTRGVDFQWNGDIPGQLPYTEVSWTIFAVDSSDQTSSFPMGEYKVYTLQNSYASVDTTGDCAILDISATGHEIEPERFFNAPNSPLVNPMDNGTAGPFYLGGVFPFYNQSMRYAWVGVNGAIALTETATETTDVNSNGFFTTYWEFPEEFLRTPRDMYSTGDMPPNFIAPFWSDMILADSIMQFGHIYWDTAGCKFIVQWGENMGIHLPDRSLMTDNIKFRVVLNRCTGMIEYQYDNVGLGGLDSTALIGFQADSILSLGNVAPWIMIHNKGFIETEPRDGTCFSIRNNQQLYGKYPWNMMPVFPRSDSDYSVHNVFNYVISPVYGFNGIGYVAEDTLEPLSCYWVKASGFSIIGSGSPVTETDILLHQGWNMVPGISCVVPVATITEAIVSGSSWFRYNHGYAQVTNLLPGKCYWVKASAAGTIHLSCNSIPAIPGGQPLKEALTNLTKFIINDSKDGAQTLYLGEEKSLNAPLSMFELPPTAPQGLFDARFTSNRMLEIIPSASEKTFSDYSIALQSSAYPLTFAWDIPADNQKTIYLSRRAGDKNESPLLLRGKGSISISKPEVETLHLRVMDDEETPLTFELLQNYPNPFNPSTVISYSLPAESWVTLSVYNILGEEVARPVREKQSAGHKSFEWNASGLPSGMYVYKITAVPENGNQSRIFTSVKKLLLLK